ncbi:tyrosine-type recombinase/integrase [Bdellovibrio sp. BCCA]|uniref:tyrosine-type recombinase/integrase n=1 Tax=Bdellovibrio sp. BCCA TaxID=3136281 RepID=UPI0030F2BAB2
MGIKKDPKTDLYIVSYAKRHPITRKPVGLKRINVKTLAEAKRIQAELIVSVNDKIKEKVMPTWGTFLTQYFESMKLSGLMNSTIYNREKVLRCHTLPTWGEKYIDEITTEEIHKLLNARLGNNAEAHKKFFIKCVRGVFQYALEQGILVRNPTPLLKFKIADKIHAVLNEEQIVLLLRKAQELNWPWYPHYAVALFTGMRNGEIYALTWDKVNLDKRQILVNVAWNSKNGYKSTKSGDDRIIEIPTPLLPTLRQLRLQSDGSDFVLPRLNKWDKGDQARELRFLLASLGLPQIRFHDLRASWATLLLSKGVAPSKVMAMGGWKDMDTMMIYMRKAGIDIKNSTSVLDNMETHGVTTGKVVKFKPV